MDTDAIIQDKSSLESNPNMIEWVDSFIRSRTRDEKDMYYNEISNMLHSDGLFTQKDHGQIIDILEQYEPTHPFASNMDDGGPYSISIGFTKQE